MRDVSGFRFKVSGCEEIERKPVAQVFCGG
jgi:hypothetical protein